MLSKKYINDGKPFLILNQLQQQVKREVEEKIKNGVYIFEKTRCPICENFSDFDTLFKKDKFGLECNVAACKKCGLLMINPRMTQNAYNDFYDKEYRRLYFGKEATEDNLDIDFEQKTPRGINIFEFIKEKANIKEFNNQYVVEIGCCSGANLKPFKEAGAQITGLDLDTKYLNYGKIHKALDLNYGSISDFKFEKSPDIIIYSHVLEHILDLDKELKRIKEISKASTYIYIEVPGILNFLNRHNDKTYIMSIGIAHTFYFSLNSLKYLFEKYGFELVYGDEFVRALFRRSERDIQYDINNLYVVHNNYLKNIERIIFFRKTKILKQKIKNKIRKILWKTKKL